MPLFTDQMGRTLDLPKVPERIVSLVPSQTELLYSLGLDKEVVGVTKFCVHPEEWRKKKAIIGGTKNFHPEKIRALQPQLIIGNKEENYREGIEMLEKEFPVWMSDIETLEGSIEMISAVGTITGREAEAREIAGRIAEGYKQLQPVPEIPCLYFIWRKPYMAVGNSTFIDEMLRRCGFRNLLSFQERYPELSGDEIKALHPPLILLSSEPYPFAEKHRQEMQNLCPSAEVLLVDGEMFSWYGSRLLHALPYMQELQEKVSGLKLQF